MQYLSTTKPFNFIFCFKKVANLSKSDVDVVYKGTNAHYCISGAESQT